MHSMKNYNIVAYYYHEIRIDFFIHNKISMQSTAPLHLECSKIKSQKDTPISYLIKFNKIKLTIVIPTH